MHIYELRPREDGRGFDLISERLAFGRLWYTEADAALQFARQNSRAHPGECRVYNARGEMEYIDSWTGDFREFGGKPK